MDFYSLASEQGLGGLWSFLSTSLAPWKGPASPPGALLLQQSHSLPPPPLCQGNAGHCVPREMLEEAEKTLGSGKNVATGSDKVGNAPKL